MTSAEADDDDQLFRMMLHDLRGPLTAIRSYSAHSARRVTHGPTGGEEPLEMVKYLATDALSKLRDFEIIRETRHGAALRLRAVERIGVSELLHELRSAILLSNVPARRGGSVSVRRGFLGAQAYILGDLQTIRHAFWHLAKNLLAGIYSRDGIVVGCESADSDPIGKALIYVEHTTRSLERAVPEFVSTHAQSVLVQIMKAHNGQSVVLRRADKHRFGLEFPLGTL